jgi:hypothetical protein
MGIYMQMGIFTRVEWKTVMIGIIGIMGIGYQAFIREAR